MLAVLVEGTQKGSQPASQPAKVRGKQGASQCRTTHVSTVCTNFICTPVYIAGIPPDRKSFINTPNVPNTGWWWWWRRGAFDFESNSEDPCGLLLLLLLLLCLRKMVCATCSGYVTKVATAFAKAPNMKNLCGWVLFARTHASEKVRLVLTNSRYAASLVYAATGGDEETHHHHTQYHQPWQ